MKVIALALALCFVSPAFAQTAAPTPTNGIQATPDLSALRAKAEQGDAAAQYALGVLYEERGSAQDHVQAVAWYRKAAGQGFAKAQFHLGGMYAMGFGVAQDDAQALVWTRKAADQGLVEAQSQLGMMYVLGLGVKRDNVQALTWFRKAADRGDDTARHMLDALCPDAQRHTEHSPDAPAVQRACRKRKESPQDNGLRLPPIVITPGP